MEPLNATNQWTFTQKIFFRLFFVYFVLYCFPFPLNIIDWMFPLTRPVYLFEGWWVELSGKYLFDIPVHNYKGNIFQRTGDVGYGYVFMFTLALMALLVAGVWTIFADKKAKYDKLHQWLRLYIRFFLACFLFNYGFIKVFPSQFPDVTASMLVQTIGDIRPAGLAWNFMGYSPTFMRFTGWMEVIAGLLLLARRTTTLGAWMALSVLSVVVMMNICYGISVKIYSLHLLAMAFFLLISEWRRIVDFFILNRQAQPSPRTQLVNHPVGKKILLACQIGLAMWILYVNILDGWEAERGWGHKFAKPLLYGIYKTEYFIKNRDTVPPLETDSFRWKRVVIDDDDNWKQSSILFSNDSSAYFSIKADTINKMIQIKSFRDTAVNYHFKYSEQDPSRILIKGMWKTDSIEVMVKKYDLNNYRLHRTKFKWIVD